MNSDPPSLPEGVAAPYDWALAQMRVPEAHRVTRGSPDVVVAVIDLGYRPHPDHRGRLWVNPRPEEGALHGWDFADNDATLEYRGPGEADSVYFRGHHAFIVGEVAAVTPACPIMILRVGYLPGQGESWPHAVDYAVRHGARVIVMPHGYIQGHCLSGTPYFYQGTDFGYPFDNPALKESCDAASAAGCLIVSGVSDNRGRRAVFASSAFESVMAVGSASRRGRAADIAPSSDYVEAAAPAGQRSPESPAEQIWGTGGDGRYIPFEGGCMAAGFAGGAAALVMSRYPGLDPSQVRQILRNTARGRGWNPYLGHGLLDAAAAVGLTSGQMEKRVAVRPAARLRQTSKGLRLALALENLSAFDIGRAVLALYAGDPTCPADAQASFTSPAELQVRQIEHTCCAIPGLEAVTATLPLPEEALSRPLYAQAFACDAGAPGDCCTVRIAIGGRTPGAAKSLIAGRGRAVAGNPAGGPAPAPEITEQAHSLLTEREL
ncbi:MAG: S8 family serine peptidase [Armatimonadetes bacterium]|nr:S8 family serine peptidase [Armatimonadota bacterium]